jgi:PTS system N-acetylgalactosamine-specific IIA component
MSEPGAPDATPGGPVALVAAHGDLAAGLRSAVEQITGRGALLDTLSNRDLSGAEVEAAIRARLAAAGAYVVFTDLPAGSCALAARRVQRDRPELTVVAGTNLSTLLDFVCAAGGACDGDVRTPDGARAVAERAVQRGQVSLCQAPARPAPSPARAG